MDHCEVCHRSNEAISILDPVDVEEAYSHIALRDHSIQRHIQSHGWRDVSFGQEEDSIEGRVVHHCEVTSTEAVKILCRSDSNKGHASHFCTYSRFVLEVAMI